MASSSGLRTIICVIAVVLNATPTDASNTSNLTAPTPTPPATTTATFVQGTYGAVTGCPVGYMTILLESECMEAATYLGYSWAGEVSDATGYQGCQALTPDGTTSLNKHPAPVGSWETSRAGQVCKADGYMGTVPTPGGTTVTSDDDMSYSMPGQSGPDYCAEQMCTAAVYDVNGEETFTPDGYWIHVNSCILWSETCPCHAQYEDTCTESYDGYSFSWCQAKIWGGCPVQCPNSQEKCYADDYDSEGMWVGVESCVAPGTCVYPTCGSNATQCTDEWGGYCVWKDDPYGCPVECTGATPKRCYVDNYDSQGWWESTTEECVAEGATCSCGTNAKSTPCVETYEMDGQTYTWEWCVPAADSCPVTCTATQKICMPISYDSNGYMDMTASITESCVDHLDNCTCGANAQMCKYVWDGVEDGYCEPTSFEGETWTCPVFCSEGETWCFAQEYDNNGIPTTFSEQCIPNGGSCNCGSTAIACTETWEGETWSYCEPKFINGQTNSCPISCSGNTEYCAMPSFNAQGDLTSFVEDCIAVGTDGTVTCPCTRGNNAKACVFSWEGYSYTECIWTNEHCPAACNDAAKPYSCPSVENYKPDGTFKSYTPPASGQECAATYGDCACGEEAKKCDDPYTGEKECYSKKGGCPKKCGTDKPQKCYVMNYHANGNYKSESEKCVKAEEKCPCGTEAIRCEASQSCVPKAFKQVDCPCSATEKECHVDYYYGNGTFHKAVIECTQKEKACKCGAGTKTCNDPQSPTGFFCIKQTDISTCGCPQPCNANSTAGKITWVSPNFDAHGVKKCDKVTCSATPPIGANAKRCPGTGALVAANVPCVDNFNTQSSSSNRSRRLAAVTGIGANTRQTATVTFGMTTNANAAKIPQVKSGIDNTLQFPASIQSTLSVNQKKVTYAVSNLGAAAASPQQIAAKLKGFISAKEAKIVKALQPFGGGIDVNHAVNIVTTATTVQGGGVATAPKQKPGGGGNNSSPTPAPGPALPTPAPGPGGGGTVTNSAEQPKLWMVVGCVVAIMLFSAKEK